MRSDRLTYPQLRIMRALAEAPLAWQTAEQLARATGLEVDEVVDRLAELDADGWITAWEEWPQGVAVTFTPLAAEFLQLRIVEVGPEETPRWAPALSPEPPPIKARRTFRDSEVLALVVDPSPGPAELAELAEEVQAHRRRRPEAEGAWPDARREAERAEKARKTRKARKRSQRGCSV